MRWLVAGLLILLPLTAQAATRDVSWTIAPPVQDQPTPENTHIERAPTQAATCQTFTEIAVVPAAVLSYADVAAPSGLVCYRVRTSVTVQIDGPVLLFSDYAKGAGPASPPPLGVKVK